MKLEISQLHSSIREIKNWEKSCSLKYYYTYMKLLTKMQFLVHIRSSKNPPSSLGPGKYLYPPLCYSIALDTEMLLWSKFY